MYLAEHANLALARRFKRAAQSTLVDLSRTPEIGAPGKISRGKLAACPVHGFEWYLFAYHPLKKDGMLIERAFHSAQD